VPDKKGRNIEIDAYTLTFHVPHLFIEGAGISQLWTAIWTIGRQWIWQVQHEVLLLRPTQPTSNPRHQIITHIDTHYSVMRLNPSMSLLLTLSSPLPAIRSRNSKSAHRYTTSTYHSTNVSAGTMITYDHDLLERLAYLHSES
jgi:hypothetical protein